MQGQSRVTRKVRSHHLLDIQPHQYLSADSQREAWTVVTPTSLANASLLARATQGREPTTLTQARSV